jgi:hypothetical protein
MNAATARVKALSAIRLEVQRLAKAGAGQQDLLMALLDETGRILATSAADGKHDETIAAAKAALARMFWDSTRDEGIRSARLAAGLAPKPERG